MPDAQKLTPTELAFTRYAEDGLLGSIMLAACFIEGGISDHAEALKECKALIKPEYFTHSHYQRYCLAILRCEQPDIIGIMDQLVKDRIWEEHDRAVLFRLHQDTVSPFDLMHYARLVVELWQKRTGESNRRQGFHI